MTFPMRFYWKIRNGGFLPLFSVISPSFCFYLYFLCISLSLIFSPDGRSPPSILLFYLFSSLCFSFFSFLFFCVCICKFLSFLILLVRVCISTVWSVWSMWKMWVGVGKGGHVGVKGLGDGEGFKLLWVYYFWIRVEKYVVGLLFFIFLWGVIK